MTVHSQELKKKRTHTMFLEPYCRKTRHHFQTQKSNSFRCTEAFCNLISLKLYKEKTANEEFSKHRHFVYHFERKTNKMLPNEMSFLFGLRNSKPLVHPEIIVTNVCCLFLCVCGLVVRCQHNFELTKDNE